jgi:hypothetical protein
MENWRLEVFRPTCDGIVTGIQIKALVGDIAAYRSVKKALKGRSGCNLFLIELRI